MTPDELATTLRTQIRAVAAGNGALPLSLPNERFEDDGKPHLRHSYQVGDGAVIGVGTAQKLRARTGRIFIEIFWPKNLGDGDAWEWSTFVEAQYRDQVLHNDLELNEPFTTPRPDSDWFVLVVSIPFRATMLS